MVSRKKLKLGKKVAFGQFIVEKTEEGVKIVPNPEGIKAGMGQVEQNSRKEVE